MTATTDLKYVNIYCTIHKHLNAVHINVQLIIVWFVVSDSSVTEETTFYLSYSVIVKATTINHGLLNCLVVVSVIYINEYN